MDAYQAIEAMDELLKKQRERGLSYEPTARSESTGISDEDAARIAKAFQDAEHEAKFGQLTRAQFSALSTEDRVEALTAGRCRDMTAGTVAQPLAAEGELTAADLKGQSQESIRQAWAEGRLDSVMGKYPEPGRMVDRDGAGE